MKRVFWFAVIALLLFEIANVYFIMPMPGSQQMNSIAAAYFLYKWRWVIRGIFAALIIIGLLRADWKRKWVAAVPLVLLAAVIYITNFIMAADAMFLQPKQLIFVNAAENKIDSSRLIIGIEIDGEAKAYPIQLIGYHHHIQDAVAGKAVLVTYCTVCRTGRVFEPLIDGRHEQFRLVGMDHFNAMLEDKTTKSWWRQVSGEAIAGKLKGKKLNELLSTQTSLANWLKSYPQSKIMQPDPASVAHYDTAFKYESGTSRSKLTGTDSLSWRNKSWVVGVKAGNETKAYDWNELKAKRLIADKIGEIPVLLVLAEDNKSFFAFERPEYDHAFFLIKDTLLYRNHFYNINGKGIDTAYALKRLHAYQEFWHSWQTFNPQTNMFRKGMK